MSSLSASKPREYSAQVSFLPARFVLMNLPTLKSTIVIMAHLWGICILMLCHLCPMRIEMMGSLYLCYNPHWTFILCFIVLTSMNDKLLYFFGVVVLARMRAYVCYPACWSNCNIMEDWYLKRQIFICVSSAKFQQIFGYCVGVPRSLRTRHI